MGNEFKIVEIIDNEISVSISTPNYVPWIILNPESGSPDDLVTIVPGESVFLNQEIVLQGGNITNDITLKNSGNIITPDGGDLTLAFGEIIRLYYSQLLAAWVVSWFSSNVGGGLTEPVIFGINTLTPQTLPTTTTIAWNTNNPQQIALDRAVEFDFTDLPASGSYEGILIIIDIDAVGGFDSPIWPGSLVNPPVIPTTANTRFSVMLYTTDGGTLVTHATSVGSSSSGSSFSGNLSDLVIDVTQDWQVQGISNFGNLTGVTGIDMDGATATIQGVKLIDLFQADQQIDSLSTGIEYTVGDLQSHLFKSLTDEIARFEESAAGVFRLDMLDHSVRDARDVTLSNASGAIIFAGSSPAIGFDSVAASLVINVPTGAKIAISENNVIGSTQIFDDSIISDTLTADSDLFIGILGTSPPTVTGQFTNDATDVFVFSGGASRNMSNIGVVAGGADVNLSNLTSVSVNDDIIPQAGKLLGSSGNEWSSVHTNNLRLGTAGVVSAANNQIFGTGTGIDFNVPTASNFDFLVNGVNVGSISNSGTLEFPNAIIDNVIHVNDIGTFTGINGDMYKEGVDVKIFSGGVERNISDLGGNIQTPWIQDIDADGFDLKDLSNIEFRVTTGAPAVGIDAIWTTSNDMLFNVATGKEFSWRIQGVNKFVLGTTFSTMSTALVVSGNLNVNGDATLGNLPADNIFIIGTFQSDLVLDNAVDFEFGTGTGTRIGTSTTQKLAFYNTTPVVQQSVASDTLANLYTVMRAYGLVA